MFKKLSEIGKRLVHQLDEESKPYYPKELSQEEKIEFTKKLIEKIREKESPKLNDNESK